MTARSTVRWYKEEKKKALRIVAHAVDYSGFKKYENENHFIRCAVMRLVREEEPNLRIRKGRPKKLLGDKSE